MTITPLDKVHTVTSKPGDICWTEAMVAGKVERPYFVPSKVSLTCAKAEPCTDCPARHSGTLIRDLLKSKDMHTLLRLTELSRLSHSKLFEYCNAKARIEENVALESYTLVPPPLSLQTVSVGGGTVRLAVCLDNLRVGGTYQLQVTPLATMRSSELLLGVLQSCAVADELEGFVLDKEMAKQIKKHMPAPNALAALYDNYALSVTRIYGRPLLNMAVDLSFHSPLQFYFGDDLVNGWSDVLIIGDTRTGKGQVCERFLEHYGLGDKVNGESVSFAGLVGGAEQINGRWTIRFGAMPCNDRKLLWIDEAGTRMDMMEMKRLTDTRSSGVARIVKIARAEHAARVRLLWSANTISTASMSSYRHGVQAVRNVIGATEDIARFDYAIGTQEGEIPLEEIDSLPERPQLLIPREVDRALILWTWTLKPDNISFTKEATLACRNMARVMVKRYCPSMWLVQGENFRYKLAKVATQFASRLASSSDSAMSGLLVDTPHVELAAEFFTKIYREGALRYEQYSVEERVKKEGGTVLC